MNNDTNHSASLDTLLAEHRKLLSEIAEIRHWWNEVDEMGTPRFGEMADHLRRLRELLVSHFEEEERGGYLSSALEVAPRFTEKAEELRTEHERLLGALDQFVAELSRPDPPFSGWQQARERLEEFLTTLRNHESAENAIIQSAFGDDVGNGD